MAAGRGGRKVSGVREGWQRIPPRLRERAREGRHFKREQNPLGLPFHASPRRQGFHMLMVYGNQALTGSPSRVAGLKTHSAAS